MPDGDKFERQLRSKLWRQAYRQASRNEDYVETVRLARSAIEQDLRNGIDCQKLEELANLIHKFQGNPLFASFDSIDRVYEFLKQLDAIAVSQLSYPGTRLAIEAAKSGLSGNCRINPNIL